MRKRTKCEDCGAPIDRNARTCSVCRAPRSGDNALPEEWVAAETARGIVDVELGSRKVMRFARGVPSQGEDAAEPLFLW